MTSRHNNTHDIRKKSWRMRFLSAGAFAAAFLVFGTTAATVHAVDENTVEQLIPHEFNGGGVAKGWNADDDYWSYSLPFTFPFYGNNYTSVSVNSNGSLHFEDTTSSTSGYLDDNYGPFIAPLWLDLRTNVHPGDDIYITENANNVIIRWQATEYGQSSNRVNFEVQLFSNGNIKMNYGEQPNPPLYRTPTVGISKGDGVTYTASAYHDISDLTIHNVQTSAWGTFGPVLASVSPPDNATGAFTTHALSMTFDMSVTKGTGDIVVKKTSDNSVAATISVASASVTGWGTDTVSIALPSPLANDTGYYVQVPGTAMKDSQNRYYGGISDTTTWNFTTRPSGSSFPFNETLDNANFIDTGNTTAHLGTSGQAKLGFIDWTKMDGSAGADDLEVSSQSGYFSLSDSTGNPIVASQGLNSDDVSVTHWDGTKWAKMDGTAGVENVSTTLGLWGTSSVTLLDFSSDTNDNPAMLMTYYDYPSYRFIYTHWDGSKWAKADGTAGYSVIFNNSPLYSWSGPMTHQLVYDSLNTPIVVWTGAPNAVKEICVARWNGSIWGKMDGTAGWDNLSNTPAVQSRYPEVATDSSGKPFVAWFENGVSVNFSHWDGSKWAKMDGTAGSEVIMATATPLSVLLKIDGSGNPMLTWYSGGDVYFTHWDGTKWAKMDGSAGNDNITNNGASGPPAALESYSGYPVILFTAGADVYFTRWTGSAWGKMDGTAGSDNVSNDVYDSEMPNMTFNGSGNPMVTWRSWQWNNPNTYTDINISTWDGTKWAKLDGTSGYSNVGPINDQNASYDSSKVISDGSDKPILLYSAYVLDESYGYIHHVMLRKADGTFVPTATIQSSKLNGMIGEITAATLNATDDTPGASTITYYLTNNGGTDWHEVTKGSEFTFPSAGNDLRWKAVLTRGSTPTIFGVTLDFTSLEQDGDGGCVGICASDSFQIRAEIGGMIALSCDDSVTMNALVGTGKSTTDGNNVADCIVTTNNANGYKMEWQASSDDMMNAQSDHFTAYSPSASGTPEVWNIPNTTSAWGAKLAATSEGYNGGSGGSGYTYPGSGWGSDDSYASGKFLNVATTPFQIMQKSAETDVDGESQSVLFAAEIGHDKIQPTGTYSVNVTITATTL